jgi:3-deoxy-7-phosphoheptulonate synthase
MVDVHPEPSEALVDGPQALTPADLTALVGDLARLADVVGRPLATTGRPDRRDQRPTLG